MAQKKERVTIYTPPGTLRFPKLNKINYGSKKFPVPEGNFETDITLDTTHPEYEAFLAKLEPLYAAAKLQAEAKFAELPVASRKELKGKNPPDGIRLRPLVSPMYDEATEELLPTVKLKLKMRAGGKTKDGKLWSNRPAAFSAGLKPLPLFINAPGNPHHGKPHPKARLLYTGTVARVAFTVDMDYVGYFANVDGNYGIKAELNAVQIIKYGDAPVRSGASYGFAAEEGYDEEDVDDSWNPDDFVSDAPTSEGSGAGAAGDNGGDF